jgi:hypothetical protein
MSCRSDLVDEPMVTHISCDGCGKVYMELASLVWGRRKRLINLLFCLECDETSKLPPRLLGGPDASIAE